MKNISKWLMEVEKSANRFYEKAALSFTDDAELSLMLKNLRDDEAMHFFAVKLIHDLTLENESFDSAITPDAESMQKTLSLIDENEKRLDAAAMTKKELIEAVVNIEFSEHNDFFLYAIRVTQLRVEGLFKGASDVGNHKAHIERFISLRPEFKYLLRKISSLPVVGRESLLVVDDDASLTEAFNQLLSEHGAVDTAANGREALEKLEGKYYAVIISDIRMPVMNGIEFFKKAVEKFPGVEKRFIFLTNCGDSYTDFFEENGIKHLEKPALMSQIRDAVNDILSAVCR